MEEAAAGTPRRRISEHVGMRGPTAAESEQIELRRSQAPASPVVQQTHDSAALQSLFAPPMLGAAHVKEEMMEHIRNSTIREEAEKLHRLRQTEQEQQLRQLGRVLGLVTRLIPSGSREITQNQEALDSIEAEYQQLIDSSAFDPTKVYSWPEVAALDKLARQVSAMMITSVKNEEVITERKFKSRFVCLGNKLKGVTGECIEEKLRHYVPASLTGVRLGLCWEMICCGTPTGGITLRLSLIHI